MNAKCKRGQAMVESMLAVIFVSFVLFFSIYIVRMLTTKILVDHAAARAARARSVGFNDFMCIKTARVAVIPVAGQSYRRMTDNEELHRIPLYLESETPGEALGILDYQWWNDAALRLNEDLGIAPRVNADMRLTTSSFSVGGSAEIESHYPLYMNQF